MRISSTACLNDQVGRIGILLWFMLASACGNQEGAITTVATKPAVTRDTTAGFYQVASHEASSGEWVLLEVDNDKGTRVQITAVCDFYQSGERETAPGNDMCDLVVGDKLIPNRLPRNPKDFVDIWKSGDTLFVTVGTGPDRVHQQFTVRSARLVQ